MEMIHRQKQEYHDFVNRLDLTPDEKELPFYKNIFKHYEDLIMKQLQEFNSFLQYARNQQTESFNLDLRSGKVTWDFEKASRDAFEKALKSFKEEQELKKYDDVQDEPFTPRQKREFTPSPDLRKKKQNLTPGSASMECAVCGTPASKRCANCKDTAYCSQRCQSINWHIHSKIC
jgi:hypothetical protein